MSKTTGKAHGDNPAFGGPWTQDKLAILEAYLDSYTTVLKNKSFHLVYIDAFAGSGKIFRGLGDDRTDQQDSEAFIAGSAVRAIEVDARAFDRLIFVEKDPKRCFSLQRLRERHPLREVHIIGDDANRFLTELGRHEYGNWRGVLFVDPFGTALKWTTVEHIAALQRLDMWLLFPVGTIGRMLPLSRKPDEVDPAWVDRLNVVFGGHHWRELYSPAAQQSLFGEEAVERAPGVDDLLEIYKGQLMKLFGTRFLQASRTLKNSKKSPLFEFIFCAGHPRGANIAKNIAGHLIKRM